MYSNIALSMLVLVVAGTIALPLNTAPANPTELNAQLRSIWQSVQKHQITNQSLEQPPVANLTVNFITQRVDNFNTQNEATFQQRYSVFNRYHRYAGPIYVVLSDFSPIFDSAAEYLLVSQSARDELGLVVLVQNRYFGQSIPTIDLTTENLQYLTVEQILADTAHLVQHLKNTIRGGRRSKVIVAGQNFGGSLAVWFRQKYPHLSDGAYASSAPLLAVQNHQQYKVDAAALIRNWTSENNCYNLIEAGFADLQALADSGNLSELNRAARVCENKIENSNDVGTLFLQVSELFSAISHIRPMINLVCDNLIENNAHQTAGVALGTTLTDVFNNECINVDYDDFIRYESITEINFITDFGLRQRSYLMCSQLGWWTTSESNEQPFGSSFPLSFFTEICTTLFGEVVNETNALRNQDRFNVEHGGLNPWISNVLFTYGSEDPKRSLNVQRDLHSSAVALEIPNASSSYDFVAIMSYDSQEVIEAKLDVMATIRSWIRN